MCLIDPISKPIMDNVLLVFEGNKLRSLVKTWRDDLQSAVKESAGNECLKFTRKIWRLNTTASRNKQDFVSDITKHNFPYINCDFPGTMTEN